jgi:uncharacterized protein (TIGR02284 family)
MDREDIIETLEDLVETSKDGEYGFRTSAEHVKNPEIQRLFQQRADECRMAAQELQRMIVQQGGKVDDEGGSVSGAMHRGWVSVKGTLAGYTDLAMLDEVERGEDTALKRYRDALNDTSLPSEVRSLIERQLQGVQRNHDQVKALRNAEKAKT